MGSTWRKFEPGMIKNKETGNYIKITEMDNRWLNNLIKWMERNGKQGDAQFGHLVAEKKRRDDNSIYIDKPASGLPGTPAESMAQNVTGGELVLPGVDGGQLTLSRFNDAAVVRIDTNGHATLVALDRSQVVMMALKVLELFNEDEVISLIYQQANKQVEIKEQVAARPPVLVDDEEIW